MIWPETIREKVALSLPADMHPPRLEMFRDGILATIEPDVAELLAAVRAARQTLKEWHDAPYVDAILPADDACVLESLLDTVLAKWEHAEPGASDAD